MNNMLLLQIWRTKINRIAGTKKTYKETIRAQELIWRSSSDKESLLNYDVNAYADFGI